MCVLESLCPPVVRPTNSFRILTDPPSSSRKVAYVCVRAASRDSTTVPRLFEPLLFFFFDWAAAAGLGSSLFFHLARPVVFFAQMRSLFQPSAPIPPSCSSSHRPRFSPVEISFGTEYFSARQSNGYSPARFSLGCCPPRSFATELVLIIATSTADVHSTHNHALVPQCPAIKNLQLK